jgi:hypothetical protein
MSILEPDAFLNDWYGWLTNQASHIALGVFVTFFICLFAFWIGGEFPFRSDVFLYCLSAYLFFEVFIQGWRWFDTIEDTVFVVGYGVGAPLAALHEVQAGQSAVMVDVVALLPFFVVAGVHLAVGVAYRAKMA